MNDTDLKKLSERDKKHLWHPLTQHQTAATRIGITKAMGASIWDEEGNEYVDGIASWYTAMYGHCNPHIVKAISKQMEELHKNGLAVPLQQREKKRYLNRF